jgi:hypothetical protein
MRIFEFPGTITMFGLDRGQAAALLDEIEEKVAWAFPAVSFVQFSRSRDRALLSRRGIDVDGQPAAASVRGRGAPSQEELEELLAGWLEQQVSEQDDLLARYAEERKREKRGDGTAPRKRTKRRA